jgi:hypothetical protein
MFMSHESYFSPPDDLEARIMPQAAAISDWYTSREARGSHHDTTIRKLLPKLSELTEEYKDTMAYIQSPLILIPHADGTESIGVGEVTGEIVGFTLSTYGTINDKLEEGPAQTGVVAVIATGGTNSVGSSPAAWIHFLPDPVRAEYIAKEVVPVLIPLIKGTHLTKIDNAIPLNLTVSHIANAEKNSQPYEHRAYVQKIERLMNGRMTGTKGIDDPLLAAVAIELNAMNASCPFLGQTVTMEADYMRVPSTVTPGRYSVVAGTASGILRSFIYDTYTPSASQHPNKPARATVQAVLLSPFATALLNAGKITDEQARLLPGSIVVPLDQNHVLTPVT